MGKYLELTDNEKDVILKKVANALNKLKQHPEYRPLVQNVFKLYDDLVCLWAKIEKKPILQDTYKGNDYVLHDIRTLIERAADVNLDNFIGLVKRLDNIRTDQKYIDTRKHIEQIGRAHV